MNFPLRRLALAFAIGLAFSATPSLAAEASPEIVNARLESQIWTTYALSPYLRANDIQISVLNGKATLAGIVDEEVNKDLAEQIALGVDGVTTVDNQISVKADHRPEPRAGERHYGAKVDDASTSAAVRAKLSWSQRAGNHPVSVATVDGKVTLTGNVASAEDKAFLNRLALNTPGVRSVDNRLAIANATTPVTTTVAEGFADTWITTKVKSTFMYSSNVSSGDISVATVGGVVTLTGSVASGAERALAIELAQNVRGVKRVEAGGLEARPLAEVASVVVDD